MIEVVNSESEANKPNPFNIDEKLQLHLWSMTLYDRGFKVIPLDCEDRPLCNNVPDRILLYELTQPQSKTCKIAVVAGSGDFARPFILGVIRVKNKILEKATKLKSIIEKTVSWHSRDEIAALILIDREYVEEFKETLDKLRSEEASILLKYSNIVKEADYYPIPIPDSSEWIKPFTNSREENYGVLVVSRELLVELLGELTQLIKPIEKPWRKIVEKTLIELSDERILSLEKTLTPLCKSRNLRNDVWRLVAGWLSRGLISPISTINVLKRLCENCGLEDYEKIANIVICEYSSAEVDIEPYRREVEKSLGVEIRGEKCTSNFDWTSLSERIISEIGEVGLNSIIELLESITGIPRRIAVISIELGVPVGPVRELLDSLSSKKRLSERITLSSSIIADLVLKHFKYIKNFTTVEDVDLGVHCWDGRRYKLCKGEIESWIEKAYTKLDLKSSGVRITVLEKEVFEIIENRTRELLRYDPSLIAFKNCTFNWDELKCIPHSPNKLAFHYIPHELDVELLTEALNRDITEEFVEKYTPKTIKAFKEWVGDKWILLFEILGFILYPRPYKKAVLLVDVEGKKEGDTGKSTYIRYLQLVLGSENYSAVSLQTLVKSDTRFVASQIYKKLANFYADLPGTALSEIGQFKVLTGEDAVTIDRKYKVPITWLPYTKHIFSANKPPRVVDPDTAFWKRWLLVEFVGEFREFIKDFENTLVDEIPRAIAIGIAAFYKVLNKKSFSFENTAEDARHKWMSRSDSIYAFMEWLKSSGALIEYPGGAVLVDDLYSHYTKYCKILDIETSNQASFTKRLKELGYVIKTHARIPRLKGYMLIEEKLREAFQKLGGVEEEREEE